MIYIIVQFSCIIYLFVNVNVTNLSILSNLLLVVATMILIAAVASMKHNLNNTSTKEKHQLVTFGIYRWIRHPMYTSFLICCFGLMLSNPHLLSQLIMLVLFIDLMLKAKLEEALLTQRYTEYNNYQKNTGRFLPFL